MMCMQRLINISSLTKNQRFRFAGKRLVYLFDCYNANTGYYIYRKGSQVFQTNQGFLNVELV